MTDEELDALKNTISEAIQKTLDDGPPKFELNTEEARNRIQQFLTDLYNKNISYEVICDETNNTPESIDKGFLNFDIYPFGRIPSDAYNPYQPLQHFNQDIEIPACPDLITRYGKVRLVDGKMELIPTDKGLKSD
jgi:hypothetical protein